MVLDDYDCHKQEATSSDLLDNDRKYELKSCIAANMTRP
jgi:hypothetical protein